MIFLFCLLFWGAVPIVWAQDMTGSPYVVSGVNVAATATDSVKAREAAFAQALTKSYAVLKERLVEDMAARAKLAMPSTIEIGKMLQDFAMTNERVSATQYTATFEMRYKPHAVDAALRVQGAAALTTPGDSSPSPSVASAPAHEKKSVPSKNNVLILPFLQTADKLVLWQGANPFRDAWARANLVGSGLQVPIGDAADQQVFNGVAATSVEVGDVTPLLERYQAYTVAIVVAQPADQPNKSMQVTIYRVEADRRLVPQKILTLSATGDVYPATMYGRAVEQLRVVVPGLFPTPLAAPTSPMATDRDLNIHAHFSTLSEWQQMRAVLQAIPGVAAVRLMAIKTGQARFQVAYGGRPEGLISELAAKGFNLTETSTPLTYDLTMVPVVAPTP